MVSNQILFFTKGNGFLLVLGLLLFFYFIFIYLDTRMRFLLLPCVIQNDGDLQVNECIHPS